jgi:hypothetical protein
MYQNLKLGNHSCSDHDDKRIGKVFGVEGIDEENA